MRFLGESPLLTLSIEGSSLNLLLVKGQAVLSWLSRPFNPRMVSGGSIQDPKGLATAIVAALSRLDGRGARVIAAFPSGRVTGQVLAIPPVKGASPDALVPREARRVLGTAVDYHHLFWAPIEQSAAGSKHYLVAVPRTDMANFMQTMALSGLRLVKVELASLALARAVGAPDAVIIHVNMETVEVMIMGDFLPVVVSQRPLELGIGTSDLLAEITDEMERAIGFYNQKNPSKPIAPTTPFYIAGKHPQVGDALVSTFQQALGRPVQMPQPSISYPENFPVAQYLVNVGLAIKR